MNNLALVVLDGNLTHDPETKQTHTGKTVTTFTVALNHGYGGDDNNRSVSYIPIETWDKLAENCADFLKKGSFVTISGDIRQDRWRDAEDKSHSKIKVVARNVRFDNVKRRE